MQEKAFPALLKDWRGRRRLSQLRLALESGVSQRHVSFLESGRAKPSRTMVLQLTETLAVPLRDRNEWLTAAGFAPMFQSRALDDPQMTQVMTAVRRMLENHEPFPAVAIDRLWNVRLANGPFEAILSLLGSGERNLFRMVFHPEGLRSCMVNWHEVAPRLWQRARREADALGGQEMQRLLDELEPWQDAVTLRPAEAAPLMPVLPMEIAKDGLRLSLFTVIATFGTAVDITAEEVRIETYFPGDEATEAFFRQQFS